MNRATATSFLMLLSLLFWSACQSISNTAAPDAARASTARLGDFMWELAALRGETVAAAEGQPTPHLVFLEAEQRLAGSAGCNRIMGQYSLSEDGGLEFGPLATTMMACPQMDTEAAFLAALSEVRSFTLQQESLLLQDETGRTLARLGARPLEM